MSSENGAILHRRLAVAVGHEFQRARVSVGLSRVEVVDRMPSDIKVHTLASYERGARHCTVARLVEACMALAVPTHVVLRRALQRGRIDLPTTGLEVDLRAIIADRASATGPMWTWAQARLADAPEVSVADLDWSLVQEMATVFRIPLPDLVSYLVRFTPEHVAVQ